MMSQRQATGADSAAPSVADVTGAKASNNHSPLTTPPTQNYGTMEFSDSPNQINKTSQAVTKQLVEAPKPAVRRKIQQASCAKTPMAPPTSSENDRVLSAINDTIQAIDQERSSLSRGAKAPLAEPNEAGGGQQNEKLDSLALAQKQPGELEGQSVVSPEQQLSSPTRPYPKKVLFIIANEFCERFSYYGLRTVLVLYFRGVLGFSDSGSTVSFHLFATLCYLTPILGAILGDSILGKYRTILYLSIVYFIGEFVLVLSSIFWDLNTLSILITWLGLLLIGIGTGGIKPCVAAFAGDQFLGNETSRRETFFSLFYAAINLGSLISMFLTPLLRSNYSCVGRGDCYPYAFGLPCLLIFIATIVFLMAHNHYYIAPLPPNNVILAFCRCTWLALRRKWAGKKLRDNQAVALSGHINHSLTVRPDEDDDAQSSSPSMSSSENETKPVAPSHKTGALSRGTGGPNPQLITIRNFDENPLESRVNQEAKVSTKRNHWLYLASDRFDQNSIEEFRSVLGILLLFLPTPVYWCLFDQQGSLWTLQATRMDGRIPGTNYSLEPDQMMVANPLLLLTAIPVYQLFIYPALNKCNIIKTPIQRMTTGGLIAALSFVASALIEFQLQANQPQLLPAQGQANLLLINGLSDCSLADATVRLEQLPAGIAAEMIPANHTAAQLLNQSPALHPLGSLSPLAAQRITSLPTSNPAPVGYKLQFKLTDHIDGPLVLATNQTVAPAPQAPMANGCPFDPKQLQELNVGPLPSQAVRLLYIDQGNGKLGYKLFNDSLALPEATRTRVRLLYEFFGSYSEAKKRKFFLYPYGPGPKRQTDVLMFNMTLRDGQVLLSDYLDFVPSPSGGPYVLRSNEHSLNLQLQDQPITFKLEPGTRKLIILHQVNSTVIKLKEELLQDNSYRISMLWQLIPYTMISMSEVMFSITGLEFSYAMAPPNLKSLILGAWSLTTALGNILTVAVEAVRPFSNIGHDFLFYAALMAADMILFALLGYQYQPYQSSKLASKSKSSQK